MNDPAAYHPLSDEELSQSLTIDSDQDSDWVPVMPVPDDVKRISPPHKLGKPSKVWVYEDQSGRMLGATARFETSKGKQTRPLTYCEKDGEREWRWKAMSTPRPLYGLPLLAQHPNKPVLVVEGEKAADAAQELFPEYVVITSSMGAKAPAMTYWGHLSGRAVWIWPDHHHEGREYANVVVELVFKAGAVSAAIVDVPFDFPDKWDLADPIPSGWNWSGITALLTSAPKSIPTIKLNIGSDIEIARCVNDDLISRYGQIAVSEGLIWRYVDTHWESLSDAELRCVVHQYDGANFGERGTVKLNRSRVDSILNEFTAMKDEVDFFSDAPVGINCLSGFIRFSEDNEPALEAHLPEHRCRHVNSSRWPVDISDKVFASSKLAHLLHGCFEGDEDAVDKVNLLGEVAGAAALGKGTQLVKPKAIVLKGVSAENGKSQIIDIIRGLLPPNAASAIPLGKFNDNTFVCGLRGKLLNASDELTSAAAVSSDTFKQIITGEPITARDVYRPAVTFRPMAQHIYATNDLPSFKGGMDRGVQRRLLVLQFNRTIPEDERVEHIGALIASQETDLLLEWAVNGARRLLKQKRFTEPDSSKLALKEWIYGADPVLAWIENEAILDPNAETQPRHAYANFKEWAIAEGYRENTLPAINTFSSRVLASGKEIKSRRTSKERFLVGLTLKSDPWG